MTREEALKVANEMRQWLKTDREKEALETLIQGLKESEDERIRTALIEYFAAPVPFTEVRGIPIQKVRDWLEKQKERKPEDRFEEAREKYQVEWSEDERIRKWLYDYISNCPNNNFAFYGGVGKDAVLNYLEKQKEKKPAEWSDEDKQWLSEVYFAIDHSMYSEDERKAMKNYIDSLRSQAKLKQERNEEDEKVRKWLLEYFYLHRDDLRGASVTSMEILSFLDKHPGNGEACGVDEFDPKPGDKFWVRCKVRCKTEKSENLWFDKGDERPAYTTQGKDGMMYVVCINKDGNGNCVSYQNKEKFLETFEIIEKP